MIQKLSLELQNAVTTDGITITGDGTEGNPLAAHLTGDGSGAALPEGGTPGQVLTRTAEGAEWGDVAGGGGGAAILSSDPVTPQPVVRTPSRTGESAATMALQFFRQITPATTMKIAGLRDRVQHTVGGGIKAQVWSMATGELVAESPLVPGAAQVGEYEALFAAPLVLNAGTAYRIGWVSTDEQVRHQGTGPFTLSGFAVHPDTYYRNSYAVAFPNTSEAASYVPTWDLLLPPPESGRQKNTVNPLDPLDVPRVSDLAALPNGGQALYTGVTPPRPVYRAADGTLYYGPAYSLQP